MHKYNHSDSNDSDSSWNVGSGSTGTIDVRWNIKSRKQLQNDSNPGQIKTTNNINTNLASEFDNSDYLHQTNNQSDSSNRSSFKEEGWVTTVVSKVRYTATKNQAQQRHKQLSRHCSSD